MFDFLTELEKDKLRNINDDEVAVSALKKLFLHKVYGMGVVKKGEPLDERNWAYSLGGLNDFAMDNETLGALLKATTKGISFVEQAFADLKTFTNKKEDPEPEQPNPGL